MRMKIATIAADTQIEITLRCLIFSQNLRAIKMIPFVGFGWKSSIVESLFEGNFAKQPHIEPL